MSAPAATWAWVRNGRRAVVQVTQMSVSRGGEVRHGRDRYRQFRSQFGSETPGLVRRGIVGVCPSNRPDSGDRAQLNTPLDAAATNGHDGGSGAREILDGDRRRGTGPEGGNRDGVEHGEWCAAIAVGQHDHALDGGQAQARPIPREVAVGFRQEVRPAELEGRGLDVECAVPHMNGEHARRQVLALAGGAEHRFDRGDAVVQREQAGDIAVGEDQRPTWQLCRPMIQLNHMIDPTETATQEGAPWLLFIHQIPPKPDYFRVKVRRRLQRLGAIAVKNSVYVLPRSDDALEDFLWLQREITADGGEAMVCEASFVSGMTNAELADLFARSTAEAESGDGASPAPLLPGRTWVTRQNVFVDRIASAWLIRRFIDREARFKFVPARGYRPSAGELRFDMFEAEYTHEGDRCTFETLLRRFRLKDRALTALGEIVHDIDCKDDKFERAEAAGVAAMIRSISLAASDDETRIARGGELFDDLYRHFRSARP